MAVEDFMAGLGSEVRARRDSLSLSQRDLADLAGVSERFVRFVEKGKATVQLEPLLAVLTTLGLELAIRSAGSPIVNAAGSPGAAEAMK
ncbi:helix-turn-helix transcriptional regulator [Paenarthrobacter sp. NPDC092416]|uniref:helix-turn-helix transcriptional regulator n=1 Tax=Paenarthrobacter sp. NPDC092416 TaxID=3364386 RepID=UPI003802EF1B